LKEDPAFRKLPAELAPILRKFPKAEGEKKQPYARRLHRERPDLTLEQISLLSGVKEINLKLDPAFRVVPENLVPIREKFPQGEDETNAAYARRLHGALSKLSIPEICLLSGVQESALRQDPAFRELPDALAPILLQFPQGESEKNQPYARRLHRERSELTLEQISLLSGVPEVALRHDPAFRELPPELAPIFQRFPQAEGEKDQPYARRLHGVLPQLSVHQISLLSGVTKRRLMNDPAFRELPEDLVPILQRFPRAKGERNKPYARRLHGVLSQLTVTQISLLSGVLESDLRKDPAYRELSPELATIVQQFPQDEGETCERYAGRLQSELPELSLDHISLLSGVPKRKLKRCLNLKRQLKSERAPASSTSVIPVNEALAESSAGRSKALKRAASEAAVAQPASQEVWGIRSVRPRLNESSGAGTPGLEHFMPEQEAQLVQTPARVEPQPDRLPSQPELTWGATRARVPRARERADPGVRIDGDLNHSLASTPEEQQGGQQGVPHATPAAMPGLDQFTVELEAQLVQTPQRAQPQPDPQPSEPDFAWGARRGRTPRAWEALADPGNPSAEYVAPEEPEELFEMLDF